MILPRLFDLKAQIELPDLRNFRPAELGSIALDEALPARRLEFRAQLSGLVGRRERPDHGPEVNALGAEIDPPDRHRAIGKLIRELGLQRAIGSLRLRLTALRRELHRIAACSP